MIDEQLRAGIEQVTRPYLDYLSSWEEIKEYYQDTYPAHKWIGALVHDLTGLQAAAKRAYTSARRRIERWADGTTRPNAASKRALIELGRRLPPKSRGVPPGGITIRIRGTFTVSSREGRRHRDITVHMDELQAYAWVNDPSYEAVFEEYGVDGDMFVGGMESDATVELA